MTDEEYEMIRIVIGYRLIARKVSYIAQVQRISEAAVKRILLEHGEVPRRGRRYWWSGPYTISEAKHKWLAFPDYIPLHIAEVSFQITNQPAWMGVTRRRHLHSLCRRIIALVGRRQKSAISQGGRCAV